MSKLPLKNTETIDEMQSLREAQQKIVDQTKNLEPRDWPKGMNDLQIVTALNRGETRHYLETMWELQIYRKDLH